MIRTRLCQAREGSEVSKTQPQPQRANACISCCCCSVAQSCPTLCDPMACSTPGLPVHHQLPELWPLSQWCHPTISSSVVSFSSRLQCFPASGSFQTSQFFASGGQNIAVSALVIILSGHPEKSMASHSSTLAWKIPWMEEPGRLQSMGSLRVGYD